MLSKNDIKWVKSLQLKKFRQKYSQFVVEGEKNITELLKSHFSIAQIFAIPTWETPKNIPLEVQIISEDEMKKISFHPTPTSVLAVVNIPTDNKNAVQNNSNIVLALDSIQDPGNLGTIIRIADWYGLPEIICNIGCADVYNPKCIAATMGSFTRVKVHYGDIVEYSRKNNFPIWCATLNGNSVYDTKISQKTILVIGNEGHGISKDIIDQCAKKITIPRIGKAESLNAAVSTAILIDNLI